MTKIIGAILISTISFVAGTHQVKPVQIRNVSIEGALVCWQEQNTTNPEWWDKYCDYR